MTKKDKKTKDHSGAIGGGIALSLFCTFILALLVYGPKSPEAFTQFSFISPWLGIPLYLILHPIIGKLFSVIVKALCQAIDIVYHFDEYQKWGNWTTTGSILFAAAWPVTTPVGIVITGIALLYGLLFKGLFQDD